MIFTKLVCSGIAFDIFDMVFVSTGAIRGVVFIVVFSVLDNNLVDVVEGNVCVVDVDEIVEVEMVGAGPAACFASCWWIFFPQSIVTSDEAEIINKANLTLNVWYYWYI